MEKHPIGDLMEVTMSKIRDMVDVNTIVGNPITTPDGVTLVPVSKVSFGFFTGGTEFPIKEQPSGFGGGNGAGVRIDPVSFVVIKGDNVRVINISPPAATTVDRLIEMAPDIIDKIEDFIDKRRDDQ